MVVPQFIIKHLLRQCGVHVPNTFDVFPVCILQYIKSQPTTLQILPIVQRALSVCMSTKPLMDPK